MPPLDGARSPERLDGTSEQEAFRLLLVEDDEGDALLVEDDLAEWLPRASLLRSRSLTEALTHSPGALDCVLLDLGLPDASGLDAVARLRARLASVPLVVLTGLDDEAAGAAAVQAGAQDYLVKGRVQGGGLARAIRYAIGRRQTDTAERELMLAEAQAREAQRLERGLTPHPVVLDSRLWVASCYKPGRSRALLGGDFLDLLQAPDGSIRALVGDVCGHGPDEAAVGVSLRATWRALAMTGADTELTFETLRRVFEQERHVPSLFATVCGLEIDRNWRTVKVTLAGHPSPLLIEPTGVGQLASAAGNPALGIGEAGWSSERLELPEQWALLLYTDGIIEGRAAGGPERLGQAGLCSAVLERLEGDSGWREHSREVLGDLVDVAEAANQGPLPDDAAMLMFGVGDGKPEEP